jgi:hypothetical protein
MKAVICAAADTGQDIVIDSAPRRTSMSMRRSSAVALTPASNASATKPLESAAPRVMLAPVPERQANSSTDRRVKLPRPGGRVVMA